MNKIVIRVLTKPVRVLKAVWALVTSTVKLVVDYVKMKFRKRRLVNIVTGK